MYVCIYNIKLKSLMEFGIGLHFSFYFYFINIYIYIYLYNLIEIIQNLQICYLKFHAMNDDFQAILKLSQNSNTLILDKV